MSSGSMVEKVARVIDAEAWAAIDDGRDAIPDALWHIRRSFARNRARAALEALREPEPRMVAAALPLIAHPTDRQRAIAKVALSLLPPVRIEQHSQGELAAAELVRDWQTMIDAALVGEKEGERG